MATRARKVVLVQPTMGMSGEFARHPPLSLLYVAAGLQGLPLEIVLLDNRLSGETWAERLRPHLGPETLFVGLTVMAGAPVANALRVSRAVKKAGAIPVVWGGALPTVDPVTVMGDPAVDYAVAGSGVAAVRSLAGLLLSSGGSPSPADLANVPGLAFRTVDGLRRNARFPGFEPISWRQIPYDLIPDYGCYGQIGSPDRVFPIYSAYGCPYGCHFCISPSLYKTFRPRWVPLPPAEVVDHIAFLQERHGATEIYFYDDDSFVDPDHVAGILRELRRRGLSIRLSFRGMRVDEILRMDDALLADLAASGTNMLHIGMESGSQRILDLFGKGITVAMVLEANRRLARQKSMIAAYNWIVGTPTETVADVRASMDLILRLLDDNPRAIIFQPNRFRPVPGAVLADLAVRHGYVPPATLDEWAHEEKEEDKREPWHSLRMGSLIRMLQVTSYFVDRKDELLLRTDTWRDRLLRVAMAVYRPLARFRFRHGITAGLWESPLFRWGVSRFRVG